MASFGGSVIDEDKSRVAQLLSNGAPRAQTAGFQKEIKAHKNGKW